MSGQESHFVQCNNLLLSLREKYTTDAAISLFALEEFARIVEDSENYEHCQNSDLEAIINSDFNYGILHLKKAVENNSKIEEKIYLIELARQEFERAYKRFSKLWDEAFFLLPETAVFIGICHLYCQDKISFSTEQTYHWFHSALENLRKLSTDYEDSGREINVGRGLAVTARMAATITAAPATIGLGMYLGLGTAATLFPPALFIFTAIPLSYGATYGVAKFGGAILEKPLNNLDDYIDALNPNEEKMRSEAAGAAGEVRIMLSNLQGF